MTRATPLTAFRNASVAVDAGYATGAPWTEAAAPVSLLAIRVDIYTELTAVEQEWRRFEAVADATPFQTFAWLATWLRHVGARIDAVPVVAVGRFADGETAFILPLAVEASRAARRLCWLGQDLCDYNAPLLARKFSERVTPDRFIATWRGLLGQIRSDPKLRYDWIDFEKMPQTIGAQINPFTYLPVAPNANSAHLTQLGSNWDAFYRAKRSSATRRRDRTKRKHMEEFGEIRYATVAAPDDVRQTLDTLWEQKRRIFARKGIGDIFARPGYRDFFLDFASNPQSRHLAHVSRVDIGPTCAAANFALLFGDCYYHVLSSYCDGQLTRYGPGTLHLRELLAHAVKLGLKRFDFTIGDEPYKLEWCDLRLDLCDYSTAATWRGWPMSAASKLRRRLKRFIKQTPWAWHTVSKLRAAMGAFKPPQAE